MHELGYSHSGSSFNFTIRQMKYIARHGEKKIMEYWLSDE